MYIGAAISLVGVILNVVTAGSLKTRIHNASPSLSSSQVTRLVDLEFAFIVILGLIGVGLWIWMAFMTKAGKNWARITGTVFFGIFTILLLVSVGGAAGGLGLIPDLILWLVGLGTVILLWRKDSSAFFRQQQFQ